jgi:hypothetical protein
MILRNGKFSGKILRKIFRTGKFFMENFPPHITTHTSTFGLILPSEDRPSHVAWYCEILGMDVDENRGTCGARDQSGMREGFLDTRLMLCQIFSTNLDLL